MKSVDEVVGEVAKLRRKIAERVAAAQTNGTIAASSQYFPLVFTNGLYYTQDMKKIIGGGDGTTPIVIGGEAVIETLSDFSGIKTIVIPSGCERPLEKWRDVFTAPSCLQKVVGLENQSEIGIIGGILYECKTKHILNLIGNEKMIVVPKDIVVGDVDLLIHYRLSEHGVERLHFCGSLPGWRVRRGKDPLSKRIKRWWDCRSWKNFKRILVESDRKCPRFRVLDNDFTNLVVTVSRENADEYTKAIVESGIWKGLRVTWGDPE